MFIIKYCAKESKDSVMLKITKSCKDGNIARRVFFLYILNYKEENKRKSNEKRIKMSSMQTTESEFAQGSMKLSIFEKGK